MVNDDLKGDGSVFINRREKLLLSITNMSLPRLQVESEDILYEGAQGPK